MYVVQNRSYRVKVVNFFFSCNLHDIFHASNYHKNRTTVGEISATSKVRNLINVYKGHVEGTREIRGLFNVLPVIATPRLHQGCFCVAF